MSDSAGLLLVSAPLAARDLPGGICPSLSALTLGSWVRSHGGSVRVLDPSVDVPPASPTELLGRVAQAVIAEAPAVVGVTCMSSHEGRFGVGLARAIKAVAPGLPVVLGGTWASPWAEEILARADAVDAVAVGPGEAVALGLARAGLSDLDRLPGLVWRDGESVVANAPAAVCRSPVSMDLGLVARPERYDIFCWTTSRGCPYRCAFCTETLSSPEHLLDPPDKLAGDAAALAPWADRWYLWICDPLFGVSRSHVAAVCDQVAGRGFEFLVESRVDVLHPDDVPRLAAAGCNLVYFGMESAARPSLLELDKIGGSEATYARYLDGARAVVEACLREDVLPVLGVVNPAPGDTPAELAATLDFLQELAALPGRLGGACRAPGVCFHAFPLRFDRGAPYDGQEARLLRLGTTFSEPPDPLFGDRTLAGASPTVDVAAAEAFREAVRALNPSAPAAIARLLRSYPRGYVEFEVAP